MATFSALSLSSSTQGYDRGSAAALSSSTSTRGYAQGANTTRVRMRGKWSGGYVWWESLNGRPDSTGVYYPYSSPSFASLTEVTTFHA